MNISKDISSLTFIQDHRRVLPEDGSAECETVVELSITVLTYEEATRSFLELRQDASSILSRPCRRQHERLSAKFFPSWFAHVEKCGEVEARNNGFSIVALVLSGLTYWVWVYRDMVSVDIIAVLSMMCWIPYLYCFRVCVVSSNVYGQRFERFRLVRAWQTCKFRCPKWKRKQHLQNNTWKNSLPLRRYPAIFNHPQLLLCVRTNGRQSSGPSSGKILYTTY